jgi:hypothetical protein
LIQFVVGFRQQFCVRIDVVFLLRIAVIYHDVFFAEKMELGIFANFFEYSEQFILGRVLFGGGVEIHNQTQKDAMLRIYSVIAKLVFTIPFQHLSRLINYAKKNRMARLTNHPEFFASMPPMKNYLQGKA